MNKFIIKSEYFNLSETEFLFKERGNWKLAEDEKDEIAFMYIDDPFAYKYTHLWKTKSIIRNAIGNEKYYISDKDLLYVNLKKRFPYISKQHMVKQYTIDVLRTDLEFLKKLFLKNRFWIFKPVVGYKGFGILVTDSYQKLINYINTFPKMKEQDKLNQFFKSRKNICVLAKYIDDTLLIGNKKFHIRFNFIFYNKDNNFRGFLFKDGFIYRAKEEFRLDDFENKDIHDTHGIKGYELIFPTDFTRLFSKKQTDFVFDQVKKVAYYLFKLLSANFPKCYPENKYCYQIFGIDIMVTNKFIVKLLESNSKASLSFPPKYRIRFFRNILECIVDDIFPPKNKIEIQNNYVEITDLVKYTYLAKSEFINTKQIEYLFKERGNWTPAKNINENVSFIYLDGKYSNDKKYKDLSKRNLLGPEKYQITDKSLLYLNLKKYMVTQYDIPKDYSKFLKKLFDKYKIWNIEQVLGKEIKVIDSYEKAIIYLRDKKSEKLIITKPIMNKQRRIRFYFLFYKDRGFLFRHAGMSNNFTKLFSEEKTDIVFDQVKEICRDLSKILSEKSVKCHTEIEHCYGVFELDVMVTDDFKIKLLRVNDEVSLENLNEQTSVSYLGNIMEIVMDDLFPPKNPIIKYRNYVEITGL